MLRKSKVHNNFTNNHADYFQLRSQSLPAKATHIHVTKLRTFRNANGALEGRVVDHWNTNNLRIWRNLWNFSSCRRCHRRKVIRKGNWAAVRSGQHYSRITSPHIQRLWNWLSHRIQNFPGILVLWSLAVTLINYYYYHRYY